jgi:hypothetical protein
MGIHAVPDSIEHEAFKMTAIPVFPNLARFLLDRAA